MDILILYIAILVVAFMVGFIVGGLSTKEKSVGTIIIDHASIPEDEPYLFLQSRVSARELMTKKKAVFDISIEKFISQK